MSEYDAPRKPAKQISKFADNLYDYLYFKLGMINYRRDTSPHFREVIGTAVLSLRNATRDFNTKILDNCGYGNNKFIVCQEVCNLYPSQEYFKRLYYISAFILEIIVWLNECVDVTVFSLGPHLWQTIFLHNFESEFENQGGWQGLLQAARDFHLVLLNEILPSENLLPGLIRGVVSRIGQLNCAPQSDVLNEALASLESLQMEVDEEEQSTQSNAGIRKDKPNVVYERSGPSSSAVGSSVAQSENLGEGTSRKLGEDVSSSHSDRKLRKRRLDSPSKMDSDTETDYLSPSKAKVEKK